ncbi:MAG: YedE-related selenium metabolism membrane protein [Phycisphaerales bacterium]|nr:MAG: YedE-related selenium metabolism membrane protein [Phycisphaerales bacterium]
MTGPKDIFASRTGIIMVGLAIGCIAASLQKLGNPPNMGVCVACFTRDIAGALGLHRAGIVQYLRPEIPAFCLGAFVAALAFREFRPRTGSSPILRFVLGMCAMIGALIFLGCPWRAMLRLAGGDWNAILGIAGLVTGIGIGVVFLRVGFSLGRTYQSRFPVGLAMPVVMLILLLLAIFYPKFGDNAALYRSESGPGSMAAPVAISIIAGMIVGFLAQRTRFCTVGAFRDLILMRDIHLLSGVIALVAAAFVMNLIFKQFDPGFVRTAADGTTSPQPAAHTVHWLNFTGMVLAGLSFCLAGGCPGRQVFLSGEGDGDAAMFVLGMLTGAAISHNFLMVGNQALAPWAVVIGLVVVLTIGITGRSVPAATG